MATQSASMFSSGTPSSTSTRSQSPPSGLPPAEYVIRRKVEQARQWLAAGRAVTDAAFDLGFSTSQYFATAFKRITNLRPRDVRPGRQVTEIVP